MTAAMQRTAELRWFFAGAIPAAVRKWFLASGLAADEAQRADHYLRCPATAVGVKFRQGNLEIKRLIQDHGVRRWAGASGRMQTSVKWSCSAPEVAGLRRRVVASRSLSVAVRKRRALRTFSCDGDLREVKARARPHDGCHVELTDLVVGRCRWWTFGFEAFAYGRPQGLTLFLLLTAKQVLDDPSRPRTFRTAQSARDAFSTVRSMSYPEWLLELRVR
jgi:hypothetical protein